MNEYYKIDVEVCGPTGERLYAADGHKAIDIKFEWFVRDEAHMEWLMRDLHRTMKGWMPDNQIWIEAGVMHGPDSDPRMHTLMKLYAYYGPEDRFVIFT